MLHLIHMTRRIVHGRSAVCTQDWCWGGFSGIQKRNLTSVRHCLSSKDDFICLTFSEQTCRATEIVSTINRETLRRSDFVAFRERTTIGVYTPSSAAASATMLDVKLGTRFGYSRLWYYSIGSIWQKFPNLGGGFFYYHISPGQPSISGELRFRVTPNNDPASFDGGYDLTLPGGYYWRTQLLAMPTGLRDLAFQDELITARDLALVSPSQRSDGNMLFYLGQPFWFDFSCTRRKLICISHDHTRRIVISNPILERRKDWRPAGNLGPFPIYKGVDLLLSAGFLILIFFRQCSRPV